MGILPSFNLECYEITKKGPVPFVYSPTSEGLPCFSRRYGTRSESDHEERSKKVSKNALSEKLITADSSSAESDSNHVRIWLEYDFSAVIESLMPSPENGMVFSFASFTTCFSTVTPFALVAFEIELSGIWLVSVSTLILLVTFTFTNVSRSYLLFTIVSRGSKEPDHLLDSPYSNARRRVLYATQDGNNSMGCYEFLVADFLPSNSTPNRVREFFIVESVFVKSRRISPRKVLDKHREGKGTILCGLEATAMSYV